MVVKIIFLFVFLFFACNNMEKIVPEKSPGSIVKATLMPDTPKSEKELVKILALGDSYTIGEGVNTSERWPVQLVNVLKNEKFNVAEPQIIAKTGWTTNNLLQAIEKENPAKDYTLVFLLIGVNNQYQGLNQESYRSEFRNLLAKSISFAGNKISKVFVLSIPDWSVTPFAKSFEPPKISNEIKIFNTINSEEAKAAGVHYIDITPISQKAENDTSLLTNDKLHPSGKMYSEWVSLLLEAVKNELKVSD